MLLCEPMLTHVDLDIAVFNSKITTKLPEKIAEAMMPLGLPASSLPLLIQDLVTGDMEALQQVEGVNSTIITAAVMGLKTAYMESFRYIWIIAIAIAAFAVLSKFPVRSIFDAENV